MPKHYIVPLLFTCINTNKKYADKHLELTIYTEFKSKGTFIKFDKDRNRDLLQFVTVIKAILNNDWEIEYYNGIDDEDCEDMESSEVDHVYK